MSFEDQVRERAYHIWLSGGMADGMEHEHWAMAEAAVKAEPVVILTKVAKKPTAKTAAKAKVAAKQAAAKIAKPTAKKAAKAEMTAH